MPHRRRKVVKWQVMHPHHNVGCRFDISDIKPWLDRGWKKATKTTTYYMNETITKTKVKHFDTGGDLRGRLYCWGCDENRELNHEGKRGCHSNCRGMCYMCEPSWGDPHIYVGIYP